MKKIFIISGKARHGKDSTYKIMKKHLEFNNKKCIRIAYGDFVKYIAKQYFGWDSKKDEKGRALLQYIGTDLVRIKLGKPTYWVERAMEVIDMIETRYDYVFITDARFCNEIEIPKNKYGNKVQSIRIDRLNFKSPLTKEQQNHISETALDSYNFDIYIKSESGLNNLENELIKKMYLYL